MISTLQYVSGDATHPQGEGTRIIAHVCNNIGKWGSGFTVSLSRRWESPERLYRYWYKVGSYEGEMFGLGGVQFIDVGYNPAHPKDRGIYVANMVAQNGIRSVSNPRPVCYKSFRGCLKKLYTKAVSIQAEVIMPHRIGCDRGGGYWEIIEQIIQEELVRNSIPVWVYNIRRT